jgi:hypothetical protein
VVAMRGSHVDDINVGVGHELSVRAICLGCRRAVDFLDEVGGPRGRGGG